MSMKIGFIVFDCKDNFSKKIDNFLIEKFKHINNSILKDEIYNNILEYDLYLNNSYSVEDINNSIKFYKIFSKTILEQNIIIVPLDQIDMIKNETLDDYRNRLERECKAKLFNCLDMDVDNNSVIKISSLIFLKEDEKDFNDTNSLIKIITNFLVGSYNISPNSFKEFNNLNYIIDSSGIGVYFKNRPLTNDNIDKVMLLLVLCKSYLLSFDKSIKLMIDIINEQKHVNTLNFFDIKNYLFELNKFFICNYFDSPVKINNNEIYYLYAYIKDRFKLTDHLKEILIKLENLKNISNLY